MQFDKNIIDINYSLKKLCYKYKKLKSYKHDIESIIDILQTGNNDNFKIFNHLMKINKDIKNISFRIYQLRNKKYNIIHNLNKIVQQKLPSKGENIIIDILKILKKYKIIYYYEWEKILPIKFKNYLRADLFVIDTQLKYYILEYDGPQHFKHSYFFHKNFTQFYIYKKRNLLKNLFASHNNIKIFRFPYTYNKIHIKYTIFTLFYKLINFILIKNNYTHF